MRNLTISINIEYKRNRTWGWNPTATVTAVLDGVRTDTTTGKASGWGYDKLSAAVCRAFSENPLLQTLLMWDGWQTDTEAYGPAVVREHEWSFGGMGMSAVTCDVFGCVVRSRRMNPFLVDFLFLPVRCRVQFVSPVSYWRLYDSP